MSVFIVCGTGSSGRYALFSGAKNQLAEANRYKFINRVTTLASRDGDVQVAEADFAKQKDASQLCFTWTADGVSYGLPSTVMEDLAADSVVVFVANTEAAVVDAVKVFGGFAVKILFVTASVEARTHRIQEKLNGSSASKEEKKQQEKVLKDKLKVAQKDASTLLLRVSGRETVEVANSGSIEAGVQQLILALDYDEEREQNRAAKNSSEPTLANYLKACTPQEYLCITVYPVLAPLLTRVDKLRPNDPVSFLALSMYQQASEHRSEVQQLEQFKLVRQLIVDQVLRDASDPLVAGVAASSSGTNV